MTERATRSAHGYGYGFQPASRDRRPLVAVEVDGVLALDNGALVPTSRHTVTARNRWTRSIDVPDAAAPTIARLAEAAEMVWVGSWSFLAHEALAPALGLGSKPWAFLPVQFDAVDAVRAYAGGRPWALITEDRLSPQVAPDEIVIVVDPRRGMADVDADALLDSLTRARA